MSWRSLLLLVSFLWLGPGFATTYQIDLIVFTHQSAADEASKSPLPLLSGLKAITLDRVLPSSSSQLNREYSALSRKAGYRVLLHTSWLQSSSHQPRVKLKGKELEGWRVKGTLQVRQSNYYLLDTELLFTPPGDHQPGFLVTQHQRLKPNTVYYLDHPKAGLLIKVHAG